MPTTNVAIVAAMEREVWPLVKDWATVTKQHDGRSYKFFEKSPVVVLCGGIGSEAARRAAVAVISLYRPVLVVSAGFAGGLDPKFETGQMFIPRHVVDAGDGSRTDTGTGEGTLITFQSVADAAQKAKLADAYGAQAVDMEAAAVARSAEACGIKFLACKVISDTRDSPLPPIMNFVSDGRFSTRRFVAHIVVRPWLWSSVMHLARNSSIAAKVLSEALADTKLTALCLESEANELSFRTK